MPSLYDRIVIGSGTTAAVYLSFFPPGDEEKVGVIGLPEPWASRGEHMMGQPPHLLMLPLEDEERPPGFGPLTQDMPKPSLSRPPTEPFLKSSTFAKQIPLDHDGESSMGSFARNKFRLAYITSVTWLGDRFKVSYQYAAGEKKGRAKFLHAKKVIAATGPGPAQEPSGPQYDEDAPKGVYFSGDTYLNHRVEVRGDIVAVEGGSATAAWCVEKAVMGGAKHVFWFTRPQDKGSKDLEEIGFEALQKLVSERFAAAFPAGDRNKWLLGCSAVTRIVGKAKAKWDTKEERLRLDFDTGLSVSVDQYAAAVGATETAPYLGSLREELKAIVDTDKHVHPSGDVILGYQAKDKRLLVVGAGTFKVDAKKLATKTETSDRYAKGNQYLPAAARPPEGIPTIIASIAALTRYLTGGGQRWGDINLMNFTELDEHFAEGIGWAFTEVALPHLKKYSDAAIARFITDQVIGTRIMKTSPYGISVEEMIALYGNLQEGGFMDETTLENLVDAYYS